MIDKCRSELKAIKQGKSTIPACYIQLSSEMMPSPAFPNAYIRLCQFHVIQAILRWDGDDKSQSTRPRISQEMKYEILIVFRALQRCRTWESWPVARETFLQQVDNLIMSQDRKEPGPVSVSDSNADSDSSQSVETEKLKTRPTAKSRATDQVRRQQSTWVREYFDCNWFTEEWIGECPKSMCGMIKLNTVTQSISLILGSPLDRLGMVHGMSITGLNEAFVYLTQFFWTTARINGEIKRIWCPTTLTCVWQH
jgi:hypothetical protein